MDNLTEFAQFLKTYGAFGMASVFMCLYLMERRERRTTQAKYEKFLTVIPTQMREFSDVQANAVENLERAFLKHGICIDEPRALEKPTAPDGDTK